MTKERYREFRDNPELNVTKEEFNKGWHFCCEWDGLLVGPGMDEFEMCCVCDGPWRE